MDLPGWSASLGARRPRGANSCGTAENSCRNSEPGTRPWACVGPERPRSAGHRSDVGRATDRRRCHRAGVRQRGADRRSGSPSSTPTSPQSSSSAGGSLWWTACRPTTLCRSRPGLPGTLPAVRVLPLDEPGRGWALRIAWTESSSAVVACVDIDLASKSSTASARWSWRWCLEVLSSVTGIRPRGRARCASSALVARIGNAVVRVLSPTHFRDAECPVKAVRTDLARRLVPEVEADGRWFDSEFLLLADRNGVSIREFALDAAWSIDCGAVPRTAGGLGELLRIAWRRHPLTRPSGREPSADR